MAGAKPTQCRGHQTPGKPPTPKKGGSLVASIVRAAVQRSASDIHIEPQSGETSVRLRVDGVLREIERIPKALQNSVASRLKILSDIDIAERRNPQDGR